MKLAPKRKRVGPPNKITKYKYGSEYRRLRNLLLQHDLKHNTDAFRCDERLMRAAILMFAGLEIGTDSVDNLYRYLGYNIPKYCIQDMSSRLRKNGIWQKGSTCCNWDDEHGYIELICDSMVAIGLLACEPVR